jgi:hypothetical protein
VNIPMKPKEAADPLGGDKAWENVDKTNGM